MTVLVCAGCGRDLEWCAFCDGDDCEGAICYRCVLYELGEARPPEPRTAD